MNKLNKTILLILCLASFRVATAQQPTLSVGKPTIISPGRWRYDNVQCVSSYNMTSITVSKTNGTVAASHSSIIPSTVLTSLGNNPKTYTYLFVETLSASQVETFIEGLEFQVTDISQPYTVVTIIDANPTKLPDGATITTFDHPDGTTHFYVWVPQQVPWHIAYNSAKSFYFMGMRGYLATITNAAENTLLTNIARFGGWSAGVRTGTPLTDGITMPAPNGDNTDFRWTCGPETGFAYYRGPRFDSPGAGRLSNAFISWAPREPTAAAFSEVPENCMQVNYYETLRWNDFDRLRINNDVRGYFIEFGGGEAYSVDGANYPANPAYSKPKVLTTNAQWHGYDPRNTVAEETTTNNLQTHVLITK